MNLQNLMAQAQKVQKEINKKVAEFEAKEFEFSYQNDAVIVRMKGDLQITDIKIVDALIDVDDKITLQEMIAEAINEAYSRLKKEKDIISTPKGAEGMRGLF